MYRIVFRDGLRQTKYISNKEYAIEFLKELQAKGAEVLSVKEQFDGEFMDIVQWEYLLLGQVR